MDENNEIEVNPEILKFLMVSVLLAEKRNLRLPLSQRKPDSKMINNIYDIVVQKVPATKE